jgi:single-stranded-DNA-specific exonuclease
MEAVVERITHALKAAQPIAVYGDYDVDGVTATALLVQALTAMGAAVQPYIPNRFDEGYGLNNDALDQLKARGAQLVITVDCGIRSPREGQHAKDIGLDLIISDHHHPVQGDLPLAAAIINPKQPGDEYPENLAGVGIAFKIGEALIPGDQAAAAWAAGSRRAGNVGILPLIGESGRWSEWTNTPRQTQSSFPNVASMQIGKTTAGNIGFVLGPRLRRRAPEIARLPGTLDDGRSARGCWRKNCANNVTSTVTQRRLSGSNGDHQRRIASCSPAGL